ncbi:MAG: DUF1801 domain-containing protein [Patescibacteria group bacterium]|jgi:hypothetical protein
MQKPTTIEEYNNSLTSQEQAISAKLQTIINTELTNATSKLWHGAPVWFLDGNPIVGYSSQKRGLRLMFWSGADFGENQLEPGTGKFKDASIFYTSVEQIDDYLIKRWLSKATTIQWDYKNIVKRRGKLVKIEIA